MNNTTTKLTNASVTALAQAVLKVSESDCIKIGKNRKARKDAKKDWGYKNKNKAALKAMLEWLWSSQFALMVEAAHPERDHEKERARFIRLLSGEIDG